VGAGAPEAVSDPRECPGRAEVNVAYTIDPQFSDEEQALIAEAMRVWEEGTGGRVRFAPGGRDLVLEKLERAAELQPWDSEWTNHVALTKGGRIWIVASLVPDPGEYRALVVHELGHHLGIGHIEDTPATYMHSTINDTPTELWKHALLTARDAAAFCEAHRCTCTP
jgi:hypothetical protein